MSFDVRPELLREVIEMGLSIHERRLNAALIERILDGWRPGPQLVISVRSPGGRMAAAQSLAVHLQSLAGRELERIMSARKRNAEFNVAFSRALTPEDKRQQILKYARDLGASRRQLRGDARAFSRWFGYDAVTDRYVRRQCAAERFLAFCLKRLGVVSAFILARLSEEASPHEVWRRLALEKTVQPVLAYEGDPRVACAAFQALSMALRALPEEVQECTVEEGTLQFIYRSAMQVRQDVWLQCEAINLLQSLSISSLEKVLEKRLLEPARGDDLFVRRHAVKVWSENIGRAPGLARLAAALLEDPSPFVRQGLAAALGGLPAELVDSCLCQLVLQDLQPQVRAAAIKEGLVLLERPEAGLAEAYVWVLLEAMRKETDDFVLRVCLHAAAEGARRLLERGDDLFESWVEEMTAAIEVLHTSAASLAVRRWAAMAREQLWLLFEPQAIAWRSCLLAEPGLPAPGRRRRLDWKARGEAEENILGRVLSAMAQNDFALELQSGWTGTRLSRGHRFALRLWRLLHELRISSPDKRQAFPHTIARVFCGAGRAPSAILAELAETKVPGEPLFIQEEQGWRPYLPLLDDVLSSLDSLLLPRPVKIYTSEGITELTPPRSLHRRLAACAKLNWRFAHYARLRNYRPVEGARPRAYLDALAALGFRLRLRPYLDGEGRQCSIDPSVARFFPVSLPFLNPEIWGQFHRYAFSAYENSLYELALFAGSIIAFFCGRHFYANVTLRRARNELALVIGGWGTRGKSGTERLKAALINSLGYGFVSKTTGCEAMFIYAAPFGKMREMFLFRPYDKATIWEQRDVLRLAKKLGSEVFLWECMALTPSYVRILQRQWMRDDLSTITNTYPDHEDLQGPAGINIPEVMCNFIPERGVLLTSEEQMLPILRQAAGELGTSFESVGWLEAGLIAPDVLKRFPYEEHPYNIALVLALAEKLGVAGEVALKEMADRVVPDLGVLKTFPPAPFRGRRLEFSNGMSANERHGTLGNWTRLGFDKHDPEAEPGIWITTVVNNRADRIPRSKVFAQILVKDICADRHVLIGGNLSGLLGYIREAWEEHIKTISLWQRKEDGSEEDPLAVLERMARRLRQPIREEHIAGRLRAMLEGLKANLPVERLSRLWEQPALLREALAAAGPAGHAEAIVAHVSWCREVLAQYQALADKLRARESGPEELDEAFRGLLWQWFSSKLVVIENYHALGSEIVLRICEETPPGMYCRVMGIQNIKGTGLDFVYRWLAWDACYRACMALRSTEPREIEQGLKALAAFKEYGPLCEEFVRETVELVRASPLAQRESFQAELAVILSNLGTSMRELQENMASSAPRSRWLEKVAGVVEEFCDAGDAVRRRKLANRIYKDLVAERISQERAVLELQELNKRQKGGWLLKRILGVQSFLARGKGLWQRKL
jgi:poly-gamma-glutamate synthase PgsB/CapB